MRLRNVKNASEILKSRPDIIICNPENYKGKWKELFGNDQPIYLEIGMGKGQFIITNAQKFPDCNFIGLELEASVLTKAIKKINEEIANLYIINYDATNIKNVFANNEIDKIFLNFSDPWPKNRHIKRRLTEKNFLDNYQDILKNDCSIEFKTDNRKLFEFSLMEFIARGWKMEKLSLNLHEDDSEVITTEYEDRFTQEGKIIYFIEVQNGKNEII